MEGASLGERLDAAIDGATLVEHARALVRIPSESGEEARVAEAFAAQLRELGFDRVERDANGNVIATLEGSGERPSVMLNGHLDHVPPGAMEAPYSAALVDGGRWGERGAAIYGRGSCDMKGNLVAGAHAVAAIRRAGLRLRGPVVLVADVREEVDGPQGVRSVLERGLRADHGISLESTGLGVFLGHRGKLELEMTLCGRTAHSSEPGNGVNAILLAARAIEALERYGCGLPGDALMGPASVAVTHARSWPFNRTPLIPDRCLLRLDRRYVRGESAAGVEAEVRALLAGLAARDPEFRYECQAVNHYPLMFTPADSAVARAALAAREAVLGEGSAPGAWRFGVNGTFMAAAGIPTVGIGPGEERWAHTPEEHVPVAALRDAARIVARTLLGLGSAAP